MNISGPTTCATKPKKAPEHNQRFLETAGCEFSIVNLHRKVNMFSSRLTPLTAFQTFRSSGLLDTKSPVLNPSGHVSTGMAWLGIIGKLVGQPGANAAEAVINKDIINLGNKYKAGNISIKDITQLAGQMKKRLDPTEIEKAFGQLTRVYDAINDPNATTPPGMIQSSYDPTSGAPQKENTEQSLTDAGTIQAVAGMRFGENALLIGPHPRLNAVLHGT